MARRRLDQPYSSYDPESNSLLQSTHAPGQGGSSGAAVNALMGSMNTMLRARDAAQKSNDERLGGGMYNPNARFQPVSYTAPGHRSWMGDTANGAANIAFENAQGAQAYAEQQAANARVREEQRYNQQREDRLRGEEFSRGLDRDRFGLESELSRGRLGMQTSFANALAQALGQRQSFGDVPMQMGGGRQSSSRSRYGNGYGLEDETRNYLMRFLKD